MTDPIPTADDLLGYARRQIILHPERYGVMGQYAMEMLDAGVAREHMYDTLTLRLTTAVLCGRTVSEKPQVELNMPETPWQHLKYKTDHRARDTQYNLKGEIAWKLWLWVPYILAVLAGRWLRKHPVKWTKVTADITFEQRILYPEIDMPAQAGRMVVYETMDINWPGGLPPWGGRLVTDPSRFLNRHEIEHQVYQDTDVSYGQPWMPPHTLAWLERHGVNVDQLVKRQ